MRHWHRVRPQQGVAGNTVAIPTRRSPTAARGLSMSQTTERSTVNEIDVRTLVPAQRHAKIFQLVDALAAGASFILVNDHDPKPLYYQMEAESKEPFKWEYIEKGPEEWKVRVIKTKE
jgi:uncharacterized protein (DUF2249 family)